METIKPYALHHCSHNAKVDIREKLETIKADYEMLYPSAKVTITYKGGFDGEIIISGSTKTTVRYQIQFGGIIFFIPSENTAMLQALIHFLKNWLDKELPYTF